MREQMQLVDGDERILGVKMREHASQVPPGFCAGAVNLRFREGVPESRRGTVHLPWLNKLHDGVVARHTTNHGAGRFKDTDGLVWTIRAADGAVYASRPNSAPVVVPLPVGVTIAQDVHFEQFEGYLIMMRGPDADALQCRDLVAGFTAVPAAPAGLGLSNIPRGRYAKTVGLRLWILTGNDEAWASDSLDHTAYALANQFRVTDGTPDNTVTMAVFNETSLVVLKERSVWRFQNLFGDLTDALLLPVTKRYGCVARNSVMDIGTDLWWWSQDGPASLLITEFNELQTSDGAQKLQPGNDILPLIQRVNGMYKSGICAAVWDRKVYFAVPLDDADAVRFDRINGVATETTQANHVLVLDSGRTYRYKKVSAETNLTSGSTVLTVSNDFIAGASTLLTVGSGVTLTSSVREVFKGVNNAVLVCDLEIPDPARGASGVWQGYDQAEGVEPKFFYLSEYLGNDRLCFAGSDGWTCLYEENFDGDAHPTPYLDLFANATPSLGQTIQVGGGTIVTVSTVQDANEMLDESAANANRYLWSDGGVTAGYYPGTLFPWTSPNAVAVKRTGGGVRFYGNANWPQVGIALSGAHFTATLVLWQEITSTFTSRAYTTPQRFALKRALVLTLFLETYRPQYDVFLVDDGVNELRQAVPDKTYSRTLYTRPFNKAAWVATNANNDFDTPYRGDYSVVCSNSTQLRSGFGVGLHQAQSPHRFRIHSRGRSAQVRLVNKAGRIRLLALGYEAVGFGRGMGVRN